MIYAGGGSTANLLALWRVHGLDVLLREIRSNGTVLSGVSAGMICWFRDGLTDSYGGLERLDDALGLIDENYRWCRASRDSDCGWMVR